MRVVVISLVLVFFAVVAKGCAGGCGEGYSEGERTGVVTKFSHKGLVQKSWEGELVMGGITTSSTGETVTANVFAFTVTKEEVVASVQEAQRTGRRVSLSYKQWLSSPLSMETNYDVVGVK